MMDYSWPIWSPAARTHFRKLRVLQSKWLRTATNAPWYVSNRQIHEDLGIPHFADHIRSRIESFDSKLADAGNNNNDNLEGTCAVQGLAEVINE
jgi:hypothetical protein